MRHIISLIAIATLAGCDAASLAGAIGATGGPAVRVSGKLYAPASQISMVAAGGGNYRILAASGEAAAGNVKMTVKPMGALLGASTPVVTGSAGEFALDLPSNVVYTATTDNGGMPSVIVVGGGATTLDLDAANHMVAAKLATSGKSPAAASITSAIATLRRTLTAAPNAVSESELSAAFDAQASAEVKTTLGI